jgi:uncharacterized iron-regulated protein
VTAILVLALALAALNLQSPVPAATYVPERVYDTRRRAFSDFEMMLADVAGTDVVFVGEQHDDPNTHRLEAAILEGLRRRGSAVTLSLEMFERDTQSTIDGYLAGRMAEEEFLKTARPWPRYATDYRALVELAKAQGWPVIASNVPRKYASAIAKSGLGILDALAPVERALVAADVRCPRDRYFTRFSESMSSHPIPDSEKLSPEERRTVTERYYLSQCVKDETMAEAIAGGVERSGKRIVVHFNGAFHSDFGLGTVDRVRRRLEGRRVAIISVLPVKDLDALAPAGEDLERADYLVYTVK